MLAESQFLNYFKVYYELLGVPGLFGAFIFFLFLLVCSLSKKGVRFLFLLFVMASMLSSSDPESTARLVAITVLRYLLLFPIALWGLVSLFSHDKKVGIVGWMLLGYCFLYVPAWIINGYAGGMRLLGQFLLWFAIIGFLSKQMYNIDQLKSILKSMGWMSWLTIAVAVIYCIISPGDSYALGRLKSLWAKPTAMAISMFFVLIVLSYRAFLMDKNYFRVVDLICIILSLLLIVMSGTRSAGVGAAIILIPFLRGKSPIYYMLALFIFALLVGVVLMIPSLREMAVERFVPSSEMTTSGRTEIWSLEWQHALEKPIFGHGPGDISDTTRPAKHNSYLSIAVEAGFLTAVWFIFICIVAVFSSIQKRRHFESYGNRKLCHHIMFSILAMIFICFFESIALGTGGAGITITWFIFYCVNALQPQMQTELAMWEENQEQHFVDGIGTV